jgi:L-lysine exporter family protein LysE/ArgO
MNQKKISFSFICACPQTSRMMMDTVALKTFLTGFGTSAALIIAIGAQNAFVLRQGLARQHVAAVVAFCALADALLITAGVAGLGALISANPALLALAKYGGAAFLLAYGLFAARRALASAHAALEVNSGITSAAHSLRTALLACAGFTFLNPHVYLDTVVLLGALASQQPSSLRHWFAVGAVAASILWFCALGFGARLLTPLFSTPTAWRALDGLIALVMFGIAASLLLT